jgi:hypothetical protein
LNFITETFIKNQIKIKFRNIFMWDLTTISAGTTTASGPHAQLLLPIIATQKKKLLPIIPARIMDWP